MISKHLSQTSYSTRANANVEVEIDVVCNPVAGIVAMGVDVIVQPLHLRRIHGFRSACSRCISASVVSPRDRNRRSIVETVVRGICMLLAIALCVEYGWDRA